MAAPFGAGQLVERVAFDRRIASPDGYGNSEDGWQEQFQCRAGYIHLRGGEGVLASRIEGGHLQVIRVRASARARQVTTDWRVRDVRRGDIFGISDVTIDTSRMWVDVLAQSTVASR